MRFPNKLTFFLIYFCRAQWRSFDGPSVGDKSIRIGVRIEFHISGVSGVVSPPHLGNKKGGVLLHAPFLPTNRLD